MTDSLERAKLYASRMFALGDVTALRFFGGAALRLEGVMLGMVMKGVLYLRVNEERRDEMIAAGGRPFIYRRRGEEVSLAYLSVADTVSEDPEILSAWAASAHHAARASGSRRHKVRHPS